MIRKLSAYVLLLLSLTACTAQPHAAEAELWTIDSFTELKELGLDQDAVKLANYLHSINYIDVDSVRGDTPEAREKSYQWLIHNYSETLVTSGITYSKLLKVAGGEEAVAVLIERIFRIHIDNSIEPLRFSEILSLSEITIIAKVGSFVPNLEISGGRSGAHYLDVKQSLNNVIPKSPVALMGAYSPHDTRLIEGQECVFFLSSTLRDYRKSASLFGRHPDEDRSVNILEKSAAPYCTEDGDVFKQKRVYGGGESLTRQEILALSHQE